MRGENPAVVWRKATDIPRSFCLECFTAYNDTALRLGLPQAATLTPDRERSMRNRLWDHRQLGREAWPRALAAIERSSFLRGHTKEQFRAHLDFVLQGKSFNKLIDGSYGNGAAHAKDPTHKTDTVAKSTCRSCHTADQTPDFEFTKFWARIDHGGASAAGSH